jgi:hypothetical protein
LNDDRVSLLDDSASDDALTEILLWRLEKLILIRDYSRCFVDWLDRILGKEDRL